MKLSTNVIVILDFDERAVEQEVFAKGFSQVSMITVYQY